MGIRTSKKKKNENLMKRMIKDLRSLSHWWIFLFFVTLISSLIVALNPLIVRSIIDVAIPKKDFKMLLLLIISFVLVFLVQVGTDGFQSYLQTVIGQKAVIKFRLKLVRKLLRLPLSFFHKNETGDLLNRLEVDTNSIDLLASRLMVLIFSQSTSLVYSLVIMAYLNFSLFLITILIIPAIYFYQKKSGNKFHKKSMEGREYISALFNIDKDMLSGMEYIKNVGNYPRIIHWYNQVLRNWSKNNIHMSILTLQNSFFMGSGALLIMLVTYGLGGYYVIDGLMSIGSLIAYKSYIEKVYISMFSLSNTWLQYKKSLSGLERIYWILDQPSLLSVGISIDKEYVKGAIIFDNVSFEYKGGVPILDRANFQIVPYTRNVIVGANGIGKSTIFRLILKHYQVDSGEILLDDEALGKYTDTQIRSKIGLISQNHFVFSNTLFENLRYVKEDVSEKEILSVLDKVGLKKWAEELPQGLETFMGNGGVQLSGGQKQKLSLAHILLKKPDILLLDEPSSSFDVTSKEMLYRCLNEDFEGCTIVIISHDVESIRENDNVIFIQNSHCIEEGAHSYLLHYNSNYRRLWNVQQNNNDLGVI